MIWRFWLESRTLASSIIKCFMKRRSGSEKRSRRPCIAYWSSCSSKASKYIAPILNLVQGSRCSSVRTAPLLRSFWLSHPRISLRHITTTNRGSRTFYSNHINHIKASSKPSSTKTPTRSTTSTTSQACPPTWKLHQVSTHFRTSQTTIFCTKALLSIQTTPKLLLLILTSFPYPVDRAMPTLSTGVHKVSKVRKTDWWMFTNAGSLSIRGSQRQTSTTPMFMKTTTIARI